MLYKYVPFDRKDILETRLIRFTQPGGFNDPFEMRPSFDLMSRADIAKLPEAPGQEGTTGPKARILTNEALSAMMNALLPGIQRTIAATVKGPGTWSLDNNLIARSVYDSKYGILSLTESPTSLLMWAQYADAHRGFVIQFDDQHEFFRKPTASDITFRQVNYSGARPILSYSSIESPDVFFTKSPEWAYEREWRFVAPLSAAAKVIDASPFPIHLFSLPEKAITGIILGTSMPPENAQALMAMCERPDLAHIKVFQVTLDTDQYELQIHPPLDGSVPPGAMSGKVVSAR